MNISFNKFLAALFICCLLVILILSGIIIKTQNETQRVNESPNYTTGDNSPIIEGNGDVSITFGESDGAYKLTPKDKEWVVFTEEDSIRVNGGWIYINKYKVQGNSSVSGR